MQTSHPRVWSAITVNNGVDVGLMAKLLDTQGRAYVRQGRWLLQYITDNADAIDAQLDSPKAYVQPYVPVKEALKEAFFDPFSYGVEPVEEPAEEFVEPKEEPKEPYEPYTCRNTPMEEAQERLREIVNVCFKTGNGLVWLENDLALWDSTNPSAWLSKMREEWGNRIHSGWLDEFMNALELWIVSH